MNSTVRLSGERPEHQGQLLGRYLETVRRNCIIVPLLGLYDQASIEEQVTVDLARVFTEMTVEGIAPRETLAGEELTGFDFYGFLQRNRSRGLLPRDKRLRIHISHDDPYNAIMATLQLPSVAERYRHNNTDINLEVEQDATLGVQLRTLAQGAHSMQFFGPQLATEAIASNRELVLMGEPGGGKSTTLRYVAYSLATGALDADMPLPTLLPGWEQLGDSGRLMPLYAPLLPLARRLSQEGTAATLDLFWAYLAESVESDLTSRQPAGGESVEEVVAAALGEIRAGNALLLLDGLDEVANVPTRERVISLVRSFLMYHPSCRVVVACRTRTYTSEQRASLRFEGWPTATLSEWVTGQIEYFIKAWYRAASHGRFVTDEQREVRGDKLIDAIRRRHDLERLGSRPLLLTVMALVHLNDGRLPEDRVSLYGRCIDILLERWEVFGRRYNAFGSVMEYIDLPMLDAKRLRPLLEDVALKIHDGPQTTGRVGQMSYGELFTMAREALGTLQHPDAAHGARRFLEYVELRAGLLQASEAGDGYVFAHPTFQEYLAGLALVRSVEFINHIMQRRHDERWMAVILLGVGHCVSEGILAMPYQLLDRLLAEDSRSGIEYQRDAIFAAEIAADVAWDRLEKGDGSFERLRRRLGDALGRVVEGNLLSPKQRLHAGNLLAGVGDRRAGVCENPPVVIRVPGGALAPGSAAAATSGGRIPVEEFEIGRHPVTNAQYHEFIQDDGYNPWQPWWDEEGRVWLRHDDAEVVGFEDIRKRGKEKKHPYLWDKPHHGMAYPNRPVVGVCWLEAMAFCRWLTLRHGGGFVYTLPTEIEWEYAARGSAGRMYPWGDTHRSMDLSDHRNAPNATVPVGSFSIEGTPEGVMDMLRNVWEWTSSVDIDDQVPVTSDRVVRAYATTDRMIVRGAGLSAVDPRCVDRRSARKDGLFSAQMGFRVVRRRTPDVR